MRTTDSFSSLSLEEIWIRLAPYESSGILINRIVHVNIAKVRHCQETWNISVIHEQIIAEAVYLERIHLSELRVIVNRILLERSLNFVCEGSTALCHFRLIVYCSKDFRCLAKRSYSKEVRRNEEKIDA